MGNIKTVTAILLFVSSASYAQFKKGSTLLGGDISFGISNNRNIQSNTEEKFTSFNICPVFAKAIRSNLFLGGSLSFGNSTSNYANGGESTNKNFSAGIFVRNYKQLFGRINAFIQGGVNAGTSKTNSENGPDSRTKVKSFNTNVSLTPGISIGVSKKLFLEAGFSNIASINYISGKEEVYNFGNTTNRETSSFGFSSSLSTSSGGLFFGARFIISK